MDFCLEVVAQSAVNKMDDKRLSVVLAPSLYKLQAIPGATDDRQAMKVRKL